jgi:hypothetical protein
MTNQNKTGQATVVQLDPPRGEPGALRSVLP